MIDGVRGYIRWWVTEEEEEDEEEEEEEEGEQEDNEEEEVQEEENGDCIPLRSYPGHPATFREVMHCEHQSQWSCHHYLQNTSTRLTKKNRCSSRFS